MESRGQTIDYDYDTSLKKYPLNKYLNTKELSHLTKQVFHQPPKEPKQSKSKKNTSCKKKSLMSTKTMSSSRARPTPSTSITITHQNYRAFSKEDIADELQHYKELCLKLRRENHSLKDKIQDKRQNYKENILDLQKKIGKLTEKSQQKRDRLEKKELHKEKKEKENERERKKGSQGSHRPMEGEFKRFFLQFMDQAAFVDSRMLRKASQQNSMESKLMMGRKILREGCDFLHSKKFKFSSIYE